MMSTMVARIVGMTLGHLWWMYAVYLGVHGDPWWAGACGLLGAVMIYSGER